MTVELAPNCVGDIFRLETSQNSLEISGTTLLPKLRIEPLLYVLIP